MWRGQRSRWKAGGAKATLALSSTHFRPTLHCPMPSLWSSSREGTAIRILLSSRWGTNIHCTRSELQEKEWARVCPTCIFLSHWGEAACWEVKSLLWPGSSQNIISSSYVLKSEATGRLSCMLWAWTTRPLRQNKATSPRELLVLNLPIQLWEALS